MSGENIFDPFNIIQLGMSEYFLRKLKHPVLVSGDRLGWKYELRDQLIIITVFQIACKIGVKTTKISVQRVVELSKAVVLCADGSQQSGQQGSVRELLCTQHSQIEIELNVAYVIGEGVKMQEGYTRNAQLICNKPIHFWFDILDIQEGNRGQGFRCIFRFLIIDQHGSMVHQLGYIISRKTLLVSTELGVSDFIIFSLQSRLGVQGKQEWVRVVDEQFTYNTLEISWWYCFF